MMFGGFVAVYSQTNYKKGYIITNEKDTVYGWIDYRTEKMNNRICNFKKDSIGTPTSFVPGDIVGYRFTNEGKFYITKNIVINNVPLTVFLEYLLKGIINLYYYPDVKEGLEYYIFEDANGKLTYVTKNQDTYKDEGNVRYTYEDTKYKGVLIFLFKDYAPIQNQIKYMDFNQSSMITLAKDYHNQVCTTGEKCIVFETKSDEKFLKIKYSIYGGVENQDSESYGTNLSPLFGGTMNFSVPRWHKSLSIQFDLNLAKLYKDNYNENYYDYHGNNLFTTYTAMKIAGNLAGKYTYPRGKFRPNIEVGINVGSWKFLEKVTDPEGNELHIYKFANDHENLSLTFFNNYYAGIGLDLNLRKDQFISFNINYQIPLLSSDYNLLQLKLGYTF